MAEKIFMFKKMTVLPNIWVLSTLLMLNIVNNSFIYFSRPMGHLRVIRHDLKHNWFFFVCLFTYTFLGVGAAPCDRKDLSSLTRD